jgi:hypothetical protein
MSNSNTTNRFLLTSTTFSGRLAEYGKQFWTSNDEHGWLLMLDILSYGAVLVFLEALFLEVIWR